MFVLKIWTNLGMRIYYTVHQIKLLIPIKTSFDRLIMKMHIYFETIHNNNNIK